MGAYWLNNPEEQAKKYRLICKLEPFIQGLIICLIDDGCSRKEALEIITHTAKVCLAKEITKE